MKVFRVVTYLTTSDQGIVPLGGRCYEDMDAAQVGARRRGAELTDLATPEAKRVLAAFGILGMRIGIEESDVHKADLLILS